MFKNLFLTAVTVATLAAVTSTASAQQGNQPRTYYSTGAGMNEQVRAVHRGWKVIYVGPPLFLLYQPLINEPINAEQHTIQVPGPGGVPIEVFVSWKVTVPPYDPATDIEELKWQKQIPVNGALQWVDIPGMTYPIGP